MNYVRYIARENDGFISLYYCFYVVLVVVVMLVVVVQQSEPLMLYVLESILLRFLPPENFPPSPPIFNYELERERAEPSV